MEGNWEGKIVNGENVWRDKGRIEYCRRLIKIKDNYGEFECGYRYRLLGGQTDI